MICSLQLKKQATKILGQCADVPLRNYSLTHDTRTERDAKRMHELELQIHLENSCSKTLTDKFSTV